MRTKSSGKPVTVWKVILVWGAFLIGTLVFMALGWWQGAENRHVETDSENGPGFAIFMFVLGGLAILAGLAAYPIILFTNCFLFDFSRPMWNDMRARIY